MDEGLIENASAQDEIPQIKVDQARKESLYNCRLSPPSLLTPQILITLGIRKIGHLHHRRRHNVLLLSFVKDVWVRR